MLTLRPTKMLARRLRLPASDVMPKVTNRVADWCVHEFREGGFRFLLLCNTASLYPLVTSGRGVTDDSTLVRRCEEALRLGLVGSELEFQYERRIVPELGAAQYAPIPDRAILSSINELILLARAARELAPVEIGPWLAQTPLKALGYESPDRVFPRLGG